MRLDRLTSKFQIAISDAQSLALGRDHQFIEPVHLMTALLNQDGGSIRPLLTLNGMDINALRSRLGEELDRLPKVSGVEGDVQLSNGLGRLLNICDKLAQQRKDQFISSELFVLAALDEKGNLAGFEIDLRLNHTRIAGRKIDDIAHHRRLASAIHGAIGDWHGHIRRTDGTRGHAHAVAASAGDVRRDDKAIAR